MALWVIIVKVPASMTPRCWSTRTPMRFQSQHSSTTPVEKCQNVCRRSSICAWGRSNPAGSSSSNSSLMRCEFGDRSVRYLNWRFSYLWHTVDCSFRRSSARLAGWCCSSRSSGGWMKQSIHHHQHESPNSDDDGLRKNVCMLGLLRRWSGI